MADVLIRELDSVVVERLKNRAKSNGRSLQGELKHILEQAARIDVVDLRLQREHIRSVLAGRTFSDSTELLRQDRER